MAARATLRRARAAADAAAGRRFPRTLVNCGGPTIIPALRAAARRSGLRCAMSRAISPRAARRAGRRRCSRCRWSAGKAWVPLGRLVLGTIRAGAIILELRLPRAMLGLTARRGARAVGRGAAGLSAQSARRSGGGRRVVERGAGRGGVDRVRARRRRGGLGRSAGAMLGAGGAMALLAALTWRVAEARSAFVLAGTVLASLAGALTAFLISIAPNPYAVAEVIDWLMGALTDRGSDDVTLALPFMVGRRGAAAADRPRARRADAGRGRRRGRSASAGPDAAAGRRWAPGWRSARASR